MKKFIIVSLAICLVGLISVFAYLSGKRNELSVADIVRNTDGFFEE